MAEALVLGGLGAIAWGFGSTLSAPSSRILGVHASVLWLSIAATTAGALLALAISGPPTVAVRDLPYLAGTALALLAATHLWATLTQRSEVSIATPIVACDGAIAAAIAVVAGHRLPAAAYMGLMAMVAGLVVLSRRQSAEPPAGRRYAVERPRGKRATVAIAALAATCFGVLFYCSGRVEGTAALWTAAFARGAVAVVVLALRGVTRPRAAGLRFAVAAGVLEVTGFGLYITGARQDLAVAAVAASQYGAVAVFVGVAYLRERLTRTQWLGAGVLVLGASVVAAGG